MHMFSCTEMYIGVGKNHHKFFNKEENNNNNNNQEKEGNNKNFHLGYTVNAIDTQAYAHKRF